MDKFDNIRNQRLNAFRNDRDLVIAVHWLRANPAKFNKQVYEPIALEVNVTDPQFAGQVEASIGGKLLRVNQIYDLLRNILDFCMPNGGRF